MVEWNEFLTLLFNLVIIPCLGLLTKYLIQYLTTKCNNLTQASSNDLYIKYVNMIQETVTSCVLTTTQTYVETLKKENKFDVEAQKHAFDMTKTAVLSILSEDAKTYMTNIVGDFDTYLTTLIESSVLTLKS